MIRADLTLTLGLFAFCCIFNIIIYRINMESFCVHPDSHPPSPNPPPSPQNRSRDAPDVEEDGTSGLKATAGNTAKCAYCPSQLPRDTFLLPTFYLCLSEGNGEEVHVGKISFAPSEVLGHGTAGTFVFR